MSVVFLNGQNNPKVVMCQRKGCRLIASLRPVLHLPAADGGESAKLEPKMALCEKHGDGGVEDFLTRQQWEVIQMKYHRSGRVPPDYKDITIEFVKYNPFRA